MKLRKQKKKFLNPEVMAETEALLGKIKAHPRLAECGYKESVASGSRVLVYCGACTSLIAWDRMSEPVHYRCGGPLIDIDRASDGEARRILDDLERAVREEAERKALEARYPFPPEAEDGRYVCAACKKAYTLGSSQAIHSPRRLACSGACELAWIGRGKPVGRKWAGFVTLYAHNKGSTVHYLGTTAVSRKQVECYFWSVGHGGGSLYAYYGDGEHDYYGIQSTFARQHYDEWAPVFELKEKGVAVDESWRVGANVRDGWELPVAR